MTKEMQFTVQKAGERLDKLINQRVKGLSRAQIQTLIKDGFVTVDGKQIKAGVKLKGGETVHILLPDEQETATESVIQPEAMPLTIIYEDKDIAVVDKPAGLVVHPGVGNETGTLVNALLARYPQLADMQDDEEAEGRMGIVHRLDKETSGLMVVALHLDALLDLMDQFQDRTVDKTYIALLERAPDTATGVVNAPIGRDPKQRKRMWVRADGRPATTEFEVIDNDFRDGQVLVRLKPLTGRTHQIRVHMAFIGCPLVGDQVYGYRKQRVGLKRQFLHAAELTFAHPITDTDITFTSDLPAGLQNILTKLR